MKNTIATHIICLVAALLHNAAHADTFGSGSNNFDIEFVVVGNPGNPNDTTGIPELAGSVPYSYRIGRYEISREIINKANSAGGLDIRISPFSFVTAGPRDDMPATGMNWLEAARFTNWLNTSTGSMPAYKFDSNGNFQLWVPGDAGYDPKNLFRNQLAKYFLPSSDEWYKAAYYDPVAEVYYDYPTGSNSVPTAVVSGTLAGTAVFDQEFENGPADIMFAGGSSPYGTRGQGGNVFEFEETDFDLMNDSSSFSPARRGGNWFLPSNQLTSRFRGSSGRPQNAALDFGFRVASRIPEPSSSTLALVAVYLGIGRRLSNVRHTVHSRS